MRTYRETISHFPGLVQVMLLSEASHGLICGTVPSELGFLGGSYVHLALENLGLPLRERWQFHKALAGRGLRIQWPSGHEGESPSSGTSSSVRV